MDIKRYFPSLDKPTQLDVLLFTRHLATMIKSGIPIVGALSTLSQQTSSPAFKKVIDQVLTQCKNGQELSLALKNHQDLFGTFYISLIEVSEQSGTLDDNLEFIAKQLAKNYSLKRTIQTAMIYPALILSSVIIMGSLISFFILPQLVDFFSAFNAALPISTRILLFWAFLFKNYSLYIFGAGVVLLGIGRYTYTIPSVRMICHRGILHVPLFGGFIRDTQLAQFSRNMGILIFSGIPVSKAMLITASTLSNECYREHVVTINNALLRGNTIGESMKKYSHNVFPPLVHSMIAVGEETGKLDQSLLYLGDFYEEEIDNFSKRLTTILEPVLLLVLGLIVGFVALAIITPIYELTGSLH